MESFLPFAVIGSKNFFNKRFLVQSNDSKMVFIKRKWNYLNRKWNYFSPFQLLYQKTYFTKESSFDQIIPKWFSEKGNGIIQTGNGNISPLFSYCIKNCL